MRRRGSERQPTLIDAERAAVFQAIGRYDDALAIYRQAAERRAGFHSIGALAVLHAERGDVAAAERFFGESRDRFRGVSPFPLALLDFQRGLMWMTQGDLHRARIWFGAAHRRLPAYAPAQGHLAEVEAALGEPEAAIAPAAPADDLLRRSRLPGTVGPHPERGRPTCRSATSGAPGRRPATTNCSRATRKPSPTTRRNSGSRREPTPIERWSLARRNLEVRQTSRGPMNSWPAPPAQMKRPVEDPSMRRSANLKNLDD